MNNYNQNQQDISYSESARRHASAGKKMIFISWCCILLIGYAFFTWYQRSGAYDTKVSRYGQTVELHIPMSSGHKYEVLGKLNNQSVMFLIDTGASIVAVSEKVAKKARLKKGLAINVQTAGGVKTAYLTKIKELVINDEITLYNVHATINPEMQDDTVLLGMGALKQLHFFHTENTLILRQK